MRRIDHRHPLQSFRFWFLVLSTVSIATAWKLDLFGNRRESAENLVTEELPEPEADEIESLEMMDDAIGGAAEPAPEPLPQYSVRPLEKPAQSAEEAGVKPYRSTLRSAGAPNTNPLRTDAPQSPFGPANPEFVAAPPETPLETDGATPVQTAMAEEIASETPAATRRDLQKTRRVVPASNSQPATLDATRVPSAPADPTAPPAVPAAAGDIDLAAVDQLIEDGDDVAAHRLMSQWYWKKAESRPLFQDRLETLARRIYLQSQVHYMDPYVVEPGDMLQAIARKHNVSWEYLAKLNRTDPKRIRPGQNLKVIKGPFAVVVDLSDFELTVHAHGYFVKRYTIGIGKDESSPIGKFKVEEKLTDPTYYGPDEVIEHDDPLNPLGEHWLGIGNSFGIHGTIEPESIGKAESQGCVRMRNEDVAEVYDFLTVGSEVLIRR